MGDEFRKQDKLSPTWRILKKLGQRWRERNSSPDDDEPSKRMKGIIEKIARTGAESQRR